MNFESVVNKAIEMVKEALYCYDQHIFTVTYSSYYYIEDESCSFLLEIGVPELQTDDGLYHLPKPVCIQIDYRNEFGEDAFLLITGEDTENNISTTVLFMTMFFESSLVKKVRE
jgi:hypothetical protein